MDVHSQDIKTLCMLNPESNITLIATLKVTSQVVGSMLALLANNNRGC